MVYLQTLRLGSSRMATRPGAAAALAGLAAFLVYVKTLAPSIVWGDSPELTAAAYTGGVAHPTGYPLYMLLAHAFVRLYPFGSIAYRMNLLAALSAALGVALVYLLMWRVTRERWASLAGTLLFAFSRTFWSQAVIAEHYCFEVLGVAGLLVCLLAWDRRGERRWLLRSAVVYGLCMTHHMMSLLLAPGLLFFALTSRHRTQFLKELRWTVPLFLLPLSLYLYLPLAALRDPPVNWGDPRTWDRFLAHITGREYHNAMFHMTGAQLWKQFRNYALPAAEGHGGFLPAQFGPAFLWLAPFGAWSLLRRQARLFGLTLLIYLVDVVYSLNYFIYNVELYYLPSHLMVALWIGCGLRQVSVWLKRWGRRMASRLARRRWARGLLGAGLLALPLGPLWSNWRVNDRHNDWSTLAYARAALVDLKPNALVFGEDDNTYFPVLYTHFVEKRRPDVLLLALQDLLRPERVRMTTRLAGRGLVVSVPPGFHARPGVRFDNRLLKRVVADNIGRRPVYLLASPEGLQTAWLTEVMAPYAAVRATNLSCVELCRHAPPLAVARPAPRFPQRVTFGPRRPDGSAGKGMEFLGYDLESLPKADGPWLRASYYWHVDDPSVARPATIWILFTNAAGGYERLTDGSPEFHNIHPFADGVGQWQQKLPGSLRERFDLFVPPRECGQRLHIRLAVAVGRQFLFPPNSASPWVEIGELPPVGPSIPAAVPFSHSNW